MNHCIISKHYEMIETDICYDNERTTRAQAVYVKMWVVKERRDVTGVCISGQGRLHGLHEPVRCAELRGDCEETQSVRAKRRLETLELPWVRNTELAAHSA